ncbi:HAMP domain-containing sensor histidine kinase [Haloarculaceae archaeon H-GB11]|nr:HAMP domain-containing sensor histidine kinase [Haloarculaceae archaeon H-GB11]
MGNRTVVKQALAGDVYVSEPERLGEPPNETYIVTVGAPVGDPQSPAGVLVGAVTIHVGDFFAATAPLETTSQSVTVARTVDGDRMVLHEPQRTFDRALTASATVRDVDWTVTVARDRTGLAERLETLALVQGVSLVLVLGSVVGLGIWDYRTNLSQTERLLDGFHALQEGRFDHELSLVAAEEWTQISDGFNEMAGGLASREQAIREREQRLGVLNRVLRHNLQNDMGVIINYAEMIREFSEPEQEEMAVEKIVSMGKGLLRHGKKARKIEDAMESAEQGPITLDVVPLVADAVAECADPYPDATVRTKLPESMPVRAISTLDYAVDNVVENAFEHSGRSDPTVDVLVQRDGDAVVITVVDDGPGIPEYEQNVFGDEDETDLEHGSGIGLWLAYWVVEKSDGELGFGDSDRGGAAVTITLPAADTDAVSDATA